MATRHHCPNKGYYGPNNRVLKGATRSIHTEGKPSTVLCYLGRTWLSLWKELECQCLAVKPVCVRECVYVCVFEEAERLSFTSSRGGPPEVLQ